MNDISIRFGTDRDIGACLEIYNYEVTHGVATFDLVPRTFEEWNAWFLQHQTPLYPLRVAVIDGTVTGYATLSPYRTKEAYRSTVELSVYVHRDCRGQGVATAIMDDILRLARENDEIHTVVSVITAGNKGSMRLHERFGFTYCGLTPQVGFKQGQYRDTETYALLV